MLVDHLIKNVAIGNRALDLRLAVADVHRQRRVVINQLLGTILGIVQPGAVGVPIAAAVRNVATETLRADNQAEHAEHVGGLVHFQKAPRSRRIHLEVAGLEGVFHAAHLHTLEARVEERDLIRILDPSRFQEVTDQRRDLIKAGRGGPAGGAHDGRAVV